MANYIPRPGSLAAHACAWFRQNPTRMLTLAQICGRWGGTAQTATAQLGAAEDAEFVLSERIGKNDVYKAGPKLNTWTPWSDSLAESHWEPDAAPAPAPAPVQARSSSSTTPPQKPTKRGARLPLLDIASLAVQRGVSLAPARGGPHRKGQSQYEALLSKLSEPDTWVAVPSAYVPSINKALVRFRKAHPTLVFRCVKFDDDTHQLQRLADRLSNKS